MERTIYECDHCGETYGVKNDVTTIPIRRRVGHEPFEVNEYDVHICLGGVEEAPSLEPAVYPSAGYVAVEHGEVVGVRRKDGQYRERGNIAVEHYEPWFGWFEEEVLRP